MENQKSFFNINLLKDVPVNLLKEFSSKFLDDKIYTHKELINSITEFELSTLVKPIKIKKKKKKEISVVNIGYNFEHTHTFEKQYQDLTTKEDVKPFDRKPCDCLGQKHDLINNCLNCGRIVCIVEGSGPCLTCAKNVPKMTQIQPKNVNTNTNFEAFKARNRLLNQQRNKKENTKVFDDQCDYFSHDNKWLDMKRRQELKQLNEQDLVNFHVDLDFENEKMNVVEIDEKETKLYELERAIKEDESNIRLNIYDEFERTVKFEKPTLPINTECVSVSCYSTTANISEECALNYPTPFCISIDEPWSAWSVNGNVSLIPCKEFVSYRGAVWVVSSLLEPNIPLYNSIYNKITNYINKKDKLNKNMRTFPSSVVLGKLLIKDCTFHASNSEVNNLYEITQAPFFLTIESILCLKNPLPLKSYPGICNSF
ncbi:hypothetical protein HZS_6211, partial [Henneguya salminicola]